MIGNGKTRYSIDLYTKGNWNKMVYKMYKLYSPDSAGYKNRTHSGAGSSKYKVVAAFVQNKE